MDPQPASGSLEDTLWQYEAPSSDGEKSFRIAEDYLCDNSGTVNIGTGQDGDSPLLPLLRYSYSVRHDSGDHLVGEGGFEIAPKNSDDPPARFSIAVMSCNQPFRNNGSVRRDANRMLSAVRQCFLQNNTKMVFMVGDQIYSDMPQPLSLFNQDYFSQVAPNGRNHILDCSFEEIRNIYHRRYRWFWNLEGWRDIRRQFPCYPILDDHDIVDNWGSHPKHREDRWQKLGQAARAAYFDYQGSTAIQAEDTLPPSFDYTMVYGNIAVFVLDLRSNRRAGKDGRIYSNEQEHRLNRFLEENRHAEVLFFVLSVPVVHLPRSLARIAARLFPANEDFSDRWSSGTHIRDRDRFLKRVYRHQKEHPRQRIVFLSGDIHIGCVHSIRWNSGPPFYQLISSGVTHDTGFFIRNGSKAIIRINRHIRTRDNALQGKVRLLSGKDRKRNPYGGLNIGLIEIMTPSSGARASLRFSLYGHRGDRPICVYRSPTILPKDPLRP